LTSGPEGVPAGTRTRTAIAQIPGVVALPGGMVPPVRLMVLEGVVETVPPQLLFVTESTTRGLGTLSTKRAPVYGELVGFWSVIVKVVGPPPETVPGEKRFVMPICWTFRRVDAGDVLVNPCWVRSPLAGIVLV
jgi:hypothetical protein